MTLFWSFWFCLSIPKKHDVWLAVFYVTGNAGSIREVRAVQILLAKFSDCMPEKIHHRERPMLQARAGGTEPNDLSSNPVESLSAGVRALSAEQTLAVEAENER